MTHIYDWLEQTPKPEEAKLHAFLDFRTRPAMYQSKNRDKLPKYSCFCEYNGATYRITGASRFGGIRLSKDYSRTEGYDKRVAAIDDCTNFTYKDKELT